MQKNKIIALIDCNNFFVSCEKLFKPKLIGKPVIVLSNNDGCVIARSEEAKALGIKMGEAVHLCKDTIKQHNVATISCNHQLYADISSRVMNSIKRLCPDLEQYSVDEAFVRLDGIIQCTDVIDYCYKIVASVKKNTGVPISIGVASSKTLAKLANKQAKQSKGRQPVFWLQHEEQIDDILKKTDLIDIWGIAKRLQASLNNLNIANAYQLKTAPLKLIRQRFGVVIERMVLELSGYCCLQLEQVTPKKQIQSSRSFGRPVTELAELQQAVAKFASTACEKLRKQRSKCQAVTVSIRTNFFNKSAKQYKNYGILGLEYPTSDTSIIIGKCHKILSQLFRHGYAYKKATVTLCEIIPNNHNQQSMLNTQTSQIRQDKLMETLDAINQKFGSSSVTFAATIAKKNSWQPSSKKRSGCYTTKWSELLEVN